MERTPEEYTRGILAAVLEPWIESLAIVEMAYQSDRKLRAQLESPSLEPAEKAVLVSSLLPQDTPAEVSNFLNILLANNDLGFLDEILVSLRRVMLEEAGGPQQAIVTSAFELSAEEQEAISARLVQQFGANLEITFVVNPEILGGIIVQVGDKMIDDSVRGRLDALRQSLGVRVS